ncbi:MAG: SAF domain-containing protein [Bifidobacteriaceae bacterium]|nr:SAF domain-containing protein [Bifidobacteriaceae bacterium]
MQLFKKNINLSILIWHGKRFLAAFLISLTVITIIFKIIDTIPKGETVVIAAANITAGKTLTAEDLEIAEVSENVSIGQAAKDPNMLVNNKSAVDIYKGQIIADNLLVGNSENLPVPDGKVPLSLTLNDSSNGKIFSKGDLINILTLNEQNKKVVYLAKNAQILSPINEKDNDQQFNVLVAVTKKEAERLAVINGLQPLSALKA